MSIFKENAPIVVVQNPGGDGEPIADLGVDGLDIGIVGFGAIKELGFAGLGVVAGFVRDPAPVAEHDQRLSVGDTSRPMYSRESNSRPNRLDTVGSRSR